MRRTYISPEFEYKKVHGSLNMLEQSTFFGSKMLEISDKIEILNENVVYFQLPNGEQLNLEAEKNLPQVVYDTVLDKQTNHSLKLDESQSEEDKLKNTRWILSISVKNILKNYIYATMKKFRTFEGLENNMTINNNVNAALLDYIDKNVLSRYKFNRVELFLKSVDLLTVGGLKYNNQYDSTMELNPGTLYTKFQTQTDVNDLDITLTFYQPDISSRYAFNYYYNLYFEKL
jgi:hypothetical protein